MANYKEPWNKGKGMSEAEKRARHAAYYLKNKGRILQRVKKHATANKEQKKTYVRWHAIFRKYKLTRQEYEKMFASQNGLCKICNKDKQLSVDHCHDSGKVRGLICRYCNVIMGIVDNSSLLSAALEYKRESK